MGIALVGIAAAFVIGLGTGPVTVAVALVALWAHEGVLLGLGNGCPARAVPLLELAHCAVIAVAALGLLAHGL